MPRLLNLLSIALLIVQQVQCDAFLEAPSSGVTIKQSQLRISKQKLSFSKKSITPQIHLSLRPERKNTSMQNLQTSFPSRGGSALHAIDPNLSSVVFNNAPFNLSTGIFAAANALGFVISILTGSHLHLDLLGTGAFALASLPTLTSQASSTRILFSSGAVAIWGTKLASFLFYRALKVKTDTRLDEQLSTIGGTSQFWFVSLLWGLVCSLPHTLGTTSSSQGSPITLAIGSTLYILGLATETKADYQKWIFKKQNPGKFCNEGLWSISQHPNFFGNLLLWGGIFIMNVDSLIVPSQEGDGILSTILGSWRVCVALLSPLFMWSLFYGQSSGAILTSVELANKKYGSDASYSSYIKNVPLIIPKVFEWLKSLFSFK
jgi:steroid 5-alpha reductase family enzyme